MATTQDDIIAELQRANAELRRERDAALAREVTLAGELAVSTAALAQRNTDFDERIEYQAATIDVLKAMSASPGDAQPVFQLIVERARAFCNADNVNLALVDRDMLHLGARRLDRDRLRIVLGADREQRRDDTRHPHVDIVAAGAALDATADMAGQLGPGPGNRAVAVIAVAL